MQSNFTDKARAALHLAARAATSLYQNYVGTEHLLVGLLRERTGVAARVLQDNGADEKKVMEMIRDLVVPAGTTMLKEKDGYSPKATEILEESHRQAERFCAKETGTEHILLAMLKDGDNVAVRLLNSLGLSVQKLYVDVLVAMGEDGTLYKEDLGGHKQKGRGGKKETSVLSQYSRNLTELAKRGKLDPVIGREKEIQRVIQILSRRTKNNPCLIGDPGVGKTAIAEGLALRIVAGEVPDTVKDKQVMTLDLSGMVAGSKYRGEFEERIKRVIKEVIQAGNVLLFLDELHTLIGAGGAEGAIDASNILKPSLARGEIQLIGATTVAEYRKYIEKDAALERRFQPVTVEEPTQEEAIGILMGIKEKYEEHHGVQISEEAVVAAVKLSERYINDRNLPDKAIDLIDEAAAALALRGMELPQNLKELEEEIEKYNTLIERSLKFEAFTQAGEQKREQDELIKKYNKAMARYRKKQQESGLTVTEQDIAQARIEKNVRDKLIKQLRSDNEHDGE